MYVHIWGVLCQRQASRVVTSDYIPQCLRDVITCPTPWYLLLVQHSWSYMIDDTFAPLFEERYHTNIKSQVKPSSPLLHQDYSWKIYTIKTRKLIWVFMECKYQQHVVEQGRCHSYPINHNKPISLTSYYVYTHIILWMCMYTYISK